MANNTSMPAHFSLYLDAMRFLAAVLVVVSHFLTHNLIPAVATGFVPELGREAVIIFFVLSGFVIMYTVTAKQATLRDYAIARAARIYSVALPALAASFAIGAAVVVFSDVSLPTSYQVNKPHIYIPFHLMFLGEFWHMSETPPWLGQYWSLSYEVWYYVLFATTYYFTGTRRLMLTAVVLILVGFKLWLLLPIWLSGVALYRWLEAHRIPTTLARVGWLGSIAALAIFKLIDGDEYLRSLGRAIWPFPKAELGSADRFLADYLVCAFVVANFACARFTEFHRLMRWKKITQALASHTFTLYIVHGLIMMVWLSFFDDGKASLINLLLLIAFTAFFTYLFGFVTERRKNEFVRFFAWIFSLFSQIYLGSRAGSRGSR